ncbi:hypothetical protein DNTS_021988 [Danionella cerebrum]|uniref:Centromere protein H C-terminal domain-containing protein n=1 Tax=Danionella cerebrum TaxID=2873325 RepID=A0A553QG33_9TELE|nr:hypothetical protein DNTS_021988 [Danionella translucida]
MSSSNDVAASDANSAETSNGVPDPSTVYDGVTPTRLLKMKGIMENQRFEMNVKLGMGKHRESCDADADLSKYESEIEQARLSYFNKTLVLNRMQIWNAIIDKIMHDDGEAERLKELTNQNTELCEKTLKILKIKKKMQEINELKDVKETLGEVQQKAKERAEAILQKYQRVVTILQNILRGIILASKVNWRDDPKLKDIVMNLEHLPN